jgi:hypothetical protein
MNRVVFVFIVLTLATLACGQSAPATPSDRCVPASFQQMDVIRAGVKGISENNDVKDGFAVRSNDFNRIWFVAAEITGPGIDPNKAVGLWAIPGELNKPTSGAWSVNGFAIEFSDWGDGTKIDAQLSISDDGAKEALSCAQQ